MGRVKVDLGWVVLLCGLYYLDETGVFFPFLAAVAIHELGHILALKAMGVSIERFHLNLSGATLETGAMSYGQEILAALAGPGMNLLSLATWWIWPRFALWGGALAAFNLLPIFPLDGGRALGAWLFWKLPQDGAETVGFLVQWVTAVVLAVGALYLSLAYDTGLWPLLLLFFLGVRIAATNWMENRL